MRKSRVKRDTEGAPMGFIGAADELVNQYTLELLNDMEITSLPTITTALYHRAIDVSILPL